MDDLNLEQKHAIVRAFSISNDRVSLSIMKKVIAVWTVIYLDREEVVKLVEWLTKWLKEN